MNDTEAVAWLGRKIGWGFADGQHQEWLDLGPAGVISRLVDPDEYGIEKRSDPFADVDRDTERLARIVGGGINAWIDAAVVSPRPLETFMEFFWSDYFAVSIRVVRPPDMFFDHMNLLASHALGNFSDLLREITVDPSMLFFLDGRLNTKDSPNENYGRELLELYSVGVGEFTEQDVKSAAIALTGWTKRRNDTVASFRPRLHDDSPQTLLGVEGVHDVDSTIDAVLAHPATPKRVVAKIAAAILGPDHDAAETSELVDEFARTWEIKPVVHGLLELAVAGTVAPVLVEPLPWYVAARRLPTPPPQFRQLQTFFRLTGQVPLRPPNVGGFPDPEAYLSTSATIARFNLASELATRAARAPGSRASVALTEDLDGLASRLGLAKGFRPATRNALDSLNPGVGRLAAALASPDLVVV